MKRDRKKEVESSTLLKVPNTEEGRAFIRQLRQYAVAGTRVLARGRGPRAKPARLAGIWHARFFQDLPPKFAEYFAVYIWKTFERETLTTIKRAELTALYKQIETLQRLDTDNKQLSDALLALNVLLNQPVPLKRLRAIHIRPRYEN